MTSQSGIRMKFGLFGGAGWDPRTLWATATTTKDFISYIKDAEQLGFGAYSWSSIILPAAGRSRRL